MRTAVARAALDVLSGEMFVYVIFGTLKTNVGAGAETNVNVIDCGSDSVSLEIPCQILYRVDHINLIRPGSSFRPRFGILWFN